MLQRQPRACGEGGWLGPLLRSKCSLGEAAGGGGVAPGGGVDGEALFPVPAAWLGFPQLSGL